MMAARKGRKRKIGAGRDAKGISRDYLKREEQDYQASIGVRAGILQAEGLAPEWATENLAGFTLGKLYLRYKTDRNDPSGISGKQFRWGNRWCGIIHAHARIMGYRMSVKSPSFIMVAGGTGGAEPEPTASDVAEIRDSFKACYNALMVTCRDHGIGVSKITYGVAVENWPLAALTDGDIGQLRLGLNTLGKALATIDGDA